MVSQNAILLASVSTTRCVKKTDMQWKQKIRKRTAISIRKPAPLDRGNSRMKYCLQRPNLPEPSVPTFYFFGLYKNKYISLQILHFICLFPTFLFSFEFFLLLTLQCS